MFYDPRNDPHGLPRDPFKSLVVPRPIGWISTVGADGVFNLGPYSFFNGVSTDPTVVMFCPGGGTLADGRKDSWKNAEDTGEFVVNMVGEAQHREMNETSADVPPDIDEFSLAGLTMERSTAVKPPRVKGAPAHLECEYLQTVELPSEVAGRRNAIILGTVVGIHIDDRILTDGFVDMEKFRPVARLGYMDYTVVDNVFTMLRPGM